MKKEKAKHESPYKGIFRFASEKKQQLTFSVILSVLSSIFGIVPYIAVAVLLQSAPPKLLLLKARISMICCMAEKKCFIPPHGGTMRMVIKIQHFVLIPIRLNASLHGVMAVFYKMGGEDYGRAK